MRKKFIEYKGNPNINLENMESRSKEFYENIKQRKTIRDFSEDIFPKSIIENCIRAAGTAPSGANMQPWHFAISTRNETRRTLRKEAENEEKEFYKHKAPKEWLNALEPLGTDANKPFIEKAPYLIGIFAKNYSLLDDGSKVKHYYSSESVGISTGILITALHMAGLSTLTHTPSPMGFMNKIFKRPKNERPFLLLVVGFAKKDALIPDIEKLPLEKISSTI
ncbi:MAG: nitroreductase family protein [Chloroflexota bacterium]|nr:nitroreductase family protein [Chloroflexota bacterium]